MQILSSFDDNGAAIECAVLSDDEKSAVAQAKEIVARRCAEAGVKYSEEQEQWMYWCFMGALRIGGVSELMRYVQEAKICGRKKMTSAGYAEVAEMEDLG